MILYTIHIIIVKEETKMAKNTKRVVVISSFRYDYTEDYLCWIPTNFDDMSVEEQNLRGYFWARPKTFMLNFYNHRPEHPVYFRSYEAARKFLNKAHELEKKYNIHIITHRSARLTDIDISMPSCNMDCFNCNKKRINHCKNLANEYQNLCGYRMCKLPDDYEIDPKRLDAPCESCLTIECPYNMNYSWN